MKDRKATPGRITAMVCSLLVLFVTGAVGCKPTDKGVKQEKKQTKEKQKNENAPTAPSRPPDVGRQPPPATRPPAVGRIPGTTPMNEANWKELHETVKKLTALKAMSSTAMGRVLKVTLKQTDTFPLWTWYEARLSKGVVAHVELRLKKDGTKALVFLKISSKVDREGLAKMMYKLGNPDAPHPAPPPMARPGGKPGTWIRNTAYSYRINGHPVYFTIEEPKGGERMVSVAIHWGD